MPLSPTPNMNLQKPEPSVTTGPAWAQMLNTLIDAVDSHDHSSGKGVKVTPSGLNINADLPFGGNDATQLRSSRFSPQGAALAEPSDANCVYAVGDNLYYNNSSGAAVQITSGTSVVSSITGAFSTSVPGAYPYTVSAGDAQRILLVDTGSARTINLPAATTALLFAIKDASGQAGTNNISVVPAGTDTIEGVNATYKLEDNSAWWFFISDGVSKWTVGIQRMQQSPPGSIMMYGAATAPAGWLLCNGSEVSQTTYARLFAVVGTTFNTGGEGGGNFRLPDMRQRFPIGKAASGTGSTLGGSGGTIDHTHTVPAHFHGMGTGADLNITASGSHFHTIDHDHATGTTDSQGAHTHSIDHDHGSTSTGAAGSHDHKMIADESVPSETPTAAKIGIARSSNQGNDNSYSLQSSQGDSATLQRTSAVEGHTHTVDLPNFTGTSGSSGSHQHNFDMPAFTGVSANQNHTHTAGNFAGRIGLVTGGVDGNAAMTSGTGNPPFLTLNFIIKT